MDTNHDLESLTREFNNLFTTYFSTVKRFAFMLLKSEEDAEDIAQDVFVKLWTKPQIWSGNKQIAQYIYVMTKNTTFNFIKRKKTESAHQEKLMNKELIHELLQSENPLNPIYYKEIQLIIRLVLDRLPERRKEFFEMSRFKEMTNKEIAKKLEISVRTVEHQIYLALKELKKIILFTLFFISL